MLYVLRQEGTPVMIGRSKLYSHSQITARVRRISREISDTIEKDKPLYAVCVLKGAALFYADLVRGMRGDVRFAFVSASSYKSGDGRMVSAGSVDMRYCSLTDKEIDGADILLVEDIVDTGRTIAALKMYFKEKKAWRVRVATLLDKPDCRVEDIEPDFSAFTLTGNPYIIGYGLDNDQKWRNLDGIYSL